MVGREGDGGEKVGGHGKEKWERRRNLKLRAKGYFHNKVWTKSNINRIDSSTLILNGFGLHQPHFGS